MTASRPRTATAQRGQGGGCDERARHGLRQSDLTFVVHYQAPGSVVSYYQQVGRAGRGVDHADVVLLRGSEDRAIQDFFIEQAFPARERVERCWRNSSRPAKGRMTRELMVIVNLGMGRLEAMLKILDVEGRSDARGAGGSSWSAPTGRTTASATRP